MFKKVSTILVLSFLISNVFTLWVANADNYSAISASVVNKFQDWKVVKIVEKAGIQYINTFSWSFDDWNNKRPHLLGDPVPYFADDESFPAALEWKVSCLGQENCGRVIISVDTKSPIVIEAATEGKANYETLGKKREDLKNRFYYFSPFEQYVDTQESQWEDVIALSPWEKWIKRIHIKEKQTKNREAKKQSIKKNTTGYFQTGATVVNVPSVNNGTPCTSPIPCYNQFPFNYNWTTCAVWCWPTALTQILAYHDRKGTFPNLFPGVVASPTVMDQIIANSIRTYMWTICSWTEWATWFASEWNGLRYARDRGYISTVLPSLITSNIFYNIRINVNQGRPMIINAAWTTGHIFVAYGWNTDTIGVNQIHVNYGWGSSTPDAWITETSIPALPGMRVVSLLPVVITP